ncbi:type II secretion system protein, pilus assembly [Bifidobacterium lemurum]|uniref:Type II secretion system protein, pilus assembly n=2 Tax=Bifidobacterium lemurum TaxID=1603886 RepID=A0A261FSC1_9BIFI|nr:type II secretion system protein, pilus assembly [Bifidobacterium lemurum]
MLAEAIAHVRSGGTVAQAFGFDGMRVSGARLSAIVESRRSPEESRQTAKYVAVSIAAACRLSEDIGCSAARCLQTVAAAYRRVRLAEDRRQQAFAVPQATSGLLSVLPAGTVLLGEMMGLSPLSFLLGTDRGLGCLALGGCCYAIGLLWNRALLRGMMTNIGIRNRDVGGTPAEDRAVPWLTLIIAMLDVALRQGASIPHALAVVGRVCGGEIGQGMVQAGSALLRGSSWHDAWVAPCAGESAADAFELIRAALEPSWTRGDTPSVRLEAVVDRLDADERAAIERAASRLSVRLLMPSGLCFLPAFVFVGIVPSIISFAI